VEWVSGEVQAEATEESTVADTCGEEVNVVPGREHLGCSAELRAMIVIGERVEGWYLIDLDRCVESLFSGSCEVSPRLLVQAFHMPLATCKSSTTVQQHRWNCRYARYNIPLVFLGRENYSLSSIV